MTTVVSSSLAPNQGKRLVTDNTVHMVTTPHLFGTQFRLIRDIDIASYSTTRFSIIF